MIPERVSPQDTRTLPAAIERAVGFTPEALTTRVSNALKTANLTGIEGRSLGHPFHLWQIEGGFVLQSPARGEPWEDNFIPSVRAQVNVPDDILPDGQILWFDRSRIWQDTDEIVSGRKIFMVLDGLLEGLEKLRK